MASGSRSRRLLLLAALGEPVLQLGADGVRRLAVAVWAVAGIEPTVWLTDVAGMSAEEAVEQMVWSALAPLRRASDHGQPNHGG